MQSRRGSLIEAAISNGTSFVISVLGNMLILPLVGLHPTWTQSLGIGSIFMFLFIGKTYAIRRFFNSQTEALCERTRQANRG